MAFCKTGLFGLGFQQNVPVEKCTVAVVSIGIVWLRKQERQQDSSPTSLFPCNLWEMLVIINSSKGGQKKQAAPILCPGVMKYARPKCHPSHSLPDYPPGASSPPPLSIAVILCRWTLNHLFCLWDGKK